MDPVSTSIRTKSKSAFDAAGNPTSTSLKPSSTRSANRRRFRAGSIGLTRAWLPSRRSVEHQTGARSSTTSGHARSGRSTVSYGRYFVNGIGIGIAWAPRRDRDALVPRHGERICAGLLPLPGKGEEPAERNDRQLVHQPQGRPFTWREREQDAHLSDCRV